MGSLQSKILLSSRFKDAYSQLEGGLNGSKQQREAGTIGWGLNLPKISLDFAYNQSAKKKDAIRTAVSVQPQTFIFLQMYQLD